MTSLIDTTTKAHVIQSDAEALEIAAQLAAEFALGASQRDQDRILPYEEVDRLSMSGLMAINVPKAYGGAGVSHVTIAEVTAILCAADSSIGQVPQNHLYLVEALRLDGTEEQKTFFFGEVLAGKRFGNAFSERGTKNVNDLKTRLVPSGEGYLVNGQKFYSTGALYAHWVPVLCGHDEVGPDRASVAFVPKGAPGLEVIDDWNCFGQKGTGSGTTLLTDIFVPKSHVLHHYLAFERPTIMGPFSQIVHAAVDVGIARGAMSEALHFVRTQARPWIDSGVEKASQDPLLIHKIGQMALKLHAAEAILKRSGEFLDVATAEMNADTVAAASIAVAEAKAMAEEAAIFITNSLFEVSGTKSTLETFNFDRHWRNARAHTVHDPSRWKYFAIGNYYLNHVKPPRHSYI